MLLLKVGVGEQGLNTELYWGFGKEDLGVGSARKLTC